MAVDKAEEPYAKRQKISHSDSKEAEVELEEGGPKSASSVFPAETFLHDTKEPTIEELLEKISTTKAICKLALHQLPSDPALETLRRDLHAVGDRSTDLFCKIGFLGPPGHGKSTLINTCIEEADLLPADSSGDSCTAVPMTLAYNNDDRCPYRAEIQFITKSAWEKEIENGLVAASIAAEDKQRLDESLPAIVKLKAVYPELELSSLHKFSVQDIFAVNHITDMLDKTKVIKGDDVSKFRSALKSQLIPQKTVLRASASEKMVQWRSGASMYPLIDHITVFVRSKLLEDGLTLLDIPGLNDSNVVKSARAEETMHTCDALVIVTDAARANASIEAREFIDRALKLIHHGGQLDRVILASTKSDNFRLLEEMPHLDDARLNDIKQSIQEAQFKVDNEERELDLRKQHLDELEIEDKELQTNLQRWQKVQTMINKGKVMNEPSIKKNGANIKPEPGQPPLDKARITRELARFKSEKKTASRNHKSQERSVNVQALVVEHARENLVKETTALSNMVFKLRSSINKTNQARMFVKKIELRDLELADVARRCNMHNDADALHVVAHDYVKLKETLPVFCLSAVAFQEMTGIRKSHGERDGIQGVEDTEMPAFAQHLSKVALDLRHEKLQHIKNDVETTLESLKMHIQKDVHAQPLDVEAAETAITNAYQLLDNFVISLEEILNQSFMDICSKYSKFMKKSQDIEARVAKQSVEELLEYRPGGDEFPSYASLRATVRRHGEWTTQNRTQINLNRLVKDIFDTTISTAMNQLFVSEVHPASSIRILEECLGSFAILFDKLRSEMSTSSAVAGVNSSDMMKIYQQHQRRKQTLIRCFSKAKDTISVSHVKAGRRVVDDIQLAWSDAYDNAYKDCTGPGASDAMIEILCGAITEDKILKTPLKHFQAELSKNIKQVKADLSDSVRSLAESLTNEYKLAFQHRHEISFYNENPALESIRNNILCLGLGLDEADVAAKENGSEDDADLGPCMDSSMGEVSDANETEDSDQDNTTSGSDVPTDEDKIIKTEHEDR